MGFVNNKLEFGERKLLNTCYYEQHIAYLKPGWCHLNSVSEEAKQKASTLEIGLHNEKPKEINHVVDPHGRSRRFKYGPLCEAKCKETFCMLSNFDTTVGDSRRYGHADFRSLGVGIKSSQYGSCAMVPMQPKTPEIIMSYTDSGDFYICGLATVDTIKKYSSIDFLNDISPALKPYGAKLGFYGYAHLIPLHDHLTIPKLKALLKTL